jgi:2-iminobutanoate/2-iminopropanoate deaminase
MTDKNQALPSAIGPYSLSRKVGNTIFVSGQIGVLPSGELLDSVEAQAEQALKNIRAILESEGAQMKDIVRATIFLTDLGNFGAVNEIYQGFFSQPYPTRACVQVSALPKNAKVEIDAIAIVE